MLEGADLLTCRNEFLWRTADMQERNTLLYAGRPDAVVSRLTPRRGQYVQAGEEIPQISSGFDFCSQPGLVVFEFKTQSCQ